MSLGGQLRPFAGIGGRGLRAAVGPGFQVLQRVDDTSTELSISGTGAVGPVFFQRAAGEVKNRAASGVPRYRGGIPAFGSGIFEAP
jgi:hypothetical protein